MGQYSDFSWSYFYERYRSGWANILTLSPFSFPINPTWYQFKASIQEKYKFGNASYILFHLILDRQQVGVRSEELQCLWYSLELITFEILAAEWLRLMRFKSWLIFDYFKHVLNIYSNGNFPQIIDPEIEMWIHFLSQEWNVLSKLPFEVSWIPLFVTLRFLDQRRSVGYFLDKRMSVGSPFLWCYNLWIKGLLLSVCNGLSSPPIFHRVGLSVCNVLSSCRRLSKFPSWARSETFRTPQNVPAWLYPCHTILLVMQIFWPDWVKFDKQF